jgi:hypothetical protein
MRPRLFQMFARERSLDPQSGTGVGLALVRRLIDLLHGDVGVEHLEPGSRFWIRLPYVPAMTPCNSSAPLSSSGRALPIYGAGNTPAMEAARAATLSATSTSAFSSPISPITSPAPALAAAGLSGRTSARDALTGSGRQPRFVPTPPLPTFVLEPASSSSSEMSVASDADGIRRKPSPDHARRELAAPISLSSSGRLPRYSAAVFDQPSPSPSSASLSRAVSPLSLSGSTTSLQGDPAFSAIRTSKPLHVDSSQQAIRKSARLLLAEDNPLNQLVMLRYLQALGYDRANVCVVADGQAAVEVVKSRDIDVVLMVGVPSPISLICSRFISSNVCGAHPSSLGLPHACFGWVAGHCSHS